MDYKKHYDLLIAKARARLRPEGYTERHHIVPKCLGGGEEDSNMVDLTVIEHYFAHLLLVKIYPLNSRVLRALDLPTKRAKIKLARWAAVKLLEAQRAHCSHVGKTGDKEGKRLNGIACKEAKKGYHNPGVKSLAGKKGGKIASERGQIQALQKEVAVLGGIASGNLSYLNKDRIFAIPPEERSRISSSTGKMLKEQGKGIFSLTKDQRTEASRKAGKSAKANGNGIFAMSSEEKSKIATKVCNTKYRCLECGYVNNPGNIGSHQKKTGHAGKEKLV